MDASEYRAQFDAVVTFANGGGLRADGFRVDVPGPDVTEQEVASLFIASLAEHGARLVGIDAVNLDDVALSLIDVRLRTLEG
jgi:hypothetical protein